jgi:hypothetical protein
MRPEALELLQTRVVRLLVVAWPKFERSGSTVKDMARWARAAGVAPNEAARWKAPLTRNEVIFENGTVHPRAVGYITGLSMKRIPRDIREPKKQAPVEKDMTQKATRKMDDISDGKNEPEY